MGIPYRTQKQSFIKAYYYCCGDPVVSCVRIGEWEIMGIASIGNYASNHILYSVLTRLDIYVSYYWLGAQL